ncbi:MAG: hypothetical protein HKN44_07475 [Ilumatobacter sp.]|nr:hypothetical protein [Ilumatobacter sp.]
MSARQTSLAEAAAVAVGGGVVAGATGSLVGLTVPAAAIGAVNGALAGWRRIYDWSSARGHVAFVLDSSWALATTASGIFANVVGLASRTSGYVPELSTRQNRHVYRAGFRPRKGYAITLGNVVSGGGDVDVPRRARLVTDHEDVHVWQARWFGPLYPLLYGAWLIVGGAVGAVAWATSRRRRGDRFAATVESAAYYLNPFEWWAYSRDAAWPPSGVVQGFGWRRPVVKPLAQVRHPRTAR